MITEESLCKAWIYRIYYNNIAMNSDNIRTVIKEISAFYHVVEGESTEGKLEKMNNEKSI